MKYIICFIFVTIITLNNAFGSIDPKKLQSDLTALRASIDLEIKLLDNQSHKELNKLLVDYDSEVDSLLVLLSHVDPTTKDGQLQLQNIEGARLQLVPKVVTESTNINNTLAGMLQKSSLDLALQVTDLDRDLQTLAQKAKQATPANLVLVSLPKLDALAAQLKQSIADIEAELKKLP
ncbi:uncharacterized protein LOC128952274 [Oppia nitens]|uniref:uncharacterized protein LOC128952274 n=1 Tax=Oppia nitens TaxID=1686743 RepID=UPI0023DBF6F6|nr:uncharacterized protein LOC128952274 [Oppia nitens]